MDLGEDASDVAIHLAAKVRGMSYDVAHQGSMFYANVARNRGAMEAAQRNGIARFLFVSAGCVYRSDCPLLLQRRRGSWGSGTHEPAYRWAKHVRDRQARCYATEYPM